jgi:1,4-dihydroxy-6-naphthoate synthase
MHRTIRLGFSACPNDTAIFHGLISGLVPLPGLHLHHRIEDVDTLNRLAANGKLDVTKVSMHAFGQLRPEYVLLRCGAALGQGCGPLVVARQPLAPEELGGRRIAVPGNLTTATLLMRLFGIDASCLVQMPFHAILPAVTTGQVDAGVLIHEARFTCEARGVFRVLDLGVWWQSLTGLPLPLGGIAARRCLGDTLHRQLEEGIRRSIDVFRAQPQRAANFIRENAQEQDKTVLEGHIGLYVNDFTRCLDKTGEAAIEELLCRAEACGILPPCPGSIFR